MILSEIKSIYFLDAVKKDQIHLSIKMYFKNSAVYVLNCAVSL